MYVEEDRQVHSLPMDCTRFLLSCRLDQVLPGEMDKNKAMQKTMLSKATQGGGLYVRGSSTLKGWNGHCTLLDVGSS